ncbi:MAG: YceI family protein [Proteobacteria bacterium]|nr:YceI family protein [Pseudomonadota bacterium]
MRLLPLALLAVAGAAAAEPVTYKIDPMHTFTHFAVRHFDAATIRGRFDKKDGEVTIDRAAGTGSARISVDVNSLSTGVPQFDKHLLSNDFFDARQYPTMTFEGNQFTFDGDKVASVAGQLTMHGQTQPLTLKATHFGCYQNPMLKREVCGGDFEATIDRTQWGMAYGVLLGQPKQVQLHIQIEAVRQQP